MHVNLHPCSAVECQVYRAAQEKGLQLNTQVDPYLQSKYLRGTDNRDINNGG